MAVIYEGMVALLIGAGVVWFFWMTFVALRRTKPPKTPKE
jgi:hypothetical protein